MKRGSVFLAAACFVLTFHLNCSSQKKLIQQTVLLQTIDQNFIDAASQYRVLKAALPQDKFPKTYHPKENKYEWSDSKWWTSGFYPGTLLYLYEQTKDETLYKEAIRILTLLEKEQFNTTTHDLGFMMFCSFGNADRIAAKQEYKNILVNSARSLSTRFNPNVGCIRSWDSKPSDFLVIIDNMMNLELLFWATRTTGDSSFYRLAVTHANTTMKNHYRPDYSSYHVLNYDAETGAVKEKKQPKALAMNRPGQEDRFGDCMALLLCTGNEGQKIFRPGKQYCRLPVESSQSAH
jgi:hypothetical protein